MGRILAAFALVLVFGVASIASSQSGLSGAEARFLSNPDDAKATVAFGEALLQENYPGDSVIYLERARFLGCVSPLLNEAHQRATRGMQGVIPVRLEPGWSAALSPDGRNMAYVTEKGLWLYSLASKQKTVITDTVQSRVSLRWNRQGTFIATLEPKRLVIIGVTGRTSWTEKLPALSIPSSLVWSADGDCVAFDLSDGVYLYRISSRELRRIYQRGLTVDFSRDSKSLLVQFKGVLYSVSLSNGQAKSITSIPNMASIDLWSDYGTSGMGRAEEHGGGDRYFGNDPVYTDLRGIRTPLKFPHSYNTALSLSADGKRFAAAESSGFVDDPFVVLWIASVDGAEYAPIDAGEIDLSPWAFSRVGDLLAYSKYEGREWIYFVTLGQ